MKRLLIISLIAVATSLPAWAGPEVHFLWADHLPELYDSQIAAYQTPVSRPPDAVRWRYDRGDAQESVRKHFPTDSSQIIKPIEVVNDSKAREPETTHRDIVKEIRQP